ncbi:dicarboxylate/amino acid:cation symporter [Companilactobacillus baiquanensis]|uniref:L-cystine uptake protein TcyP n=1 Tax=Companilactobacillus baiquanensis TaxID=2486005 RepID=A0ABW1UVR2_9LACO|nr:dicarboxylate/amino acid:cation symporter [Companilactobacillus baiquanensis]
MNVTMNLTTLLVSLVACYFIYVLNKKTNFTFTSVVALIVGIVIGLIFKGDTSYVAVLGTIYTRVISMMVIPLLMVSLIKSIYSMQSLKQLKKIGSKSLFWLLFQTLLAAIVGAALAVGSGIGKGSHLSVVNGFKVEKIPKFTEVITDFFSDNLFTSMAEGKVIPIVFFSIIVGIAVVALSSKRPKSMKTFKAFIDDCHDIVYQIIRVIIKFLPYSIIFLMADTIGTSDAKALMPLVTIIVLAFVGCFFHMYVTDSILLKLVAKRSPVQYFKNIMPAQLMAFSSRSSSGTLPLYVECLTKKEGVSESIANFVGPLGTTVGMSGCAGIWPPLLSIYAMNSLGMNVSLLQVVVIVLLCPVVSLGTAGVPGGGIMLATAMFVTLGLPVELVSIFAGIDAFANMARTTTNVTSSMVAATLVNASENKVAVADSPKTKPAMA